MRLENNKQQSKRGGQSPQKGDKTMTQEELNKVLERHSHWIRRDCAGWENMRAILDGENLDRLDLRRGFA